MIFPLKKQIGSSRAGMVRCAALTLAVLVACAANAQAALISGLFPTGVDAGGLTLSGGSLDPHYTLISSDDPSFPIPKAFVVTSSETNPFPPGWAVNAPNNLTSAWISANPLQTGAGVVGNTAGTFIYRLIFSLAGDQNPALASISGNWTGDDVTLIYLNGVYTGNTNVSGLSGFPSLKAFNIPSGPGPSLFVAGVNHLDFVVVNGAVGTAGLLVRDITGEAPIIPEPSTVLLSLVGCIGLGFAAWHCRNC